MTTTSRLRLTATIGAAALLSTAACSGFEDPDATPGEGSPEGTAEGIVIALAAEPVSLDPCDSQDSANAVVLRGNITESITRLDAESGEVIPGLAESWEEVEDDTWRFTLRPDVTFHDGEALTPEVVAAAIERVQDVELGCQNFEQLPYPLETTVIDEQTLEVVSTEPDPILPLRLSWVDVGTPAMAEDSKTPEPIGTGPYRFIDRVQGESVTVEAFPDYWGDAPDVPAATYVYRTEPSVRAGMVTAGEADLAVPISVTEATDDDRTREYSDNRVFFLRSHTDRAPFDDPRVRHAAHLAIDKDTIVEALMDRSGVPYDQLIAPTVNAYIPDYEGPTFDPEEARRLLDEAAADGVQVDTAFDLITRPDLFPGSDEVIQAIHQNLTDVGFDVGIQSLDTDAWLQLLRAPFPEDQTPTLLASSHDNITGDASFTYSRYVDSAGPNSTIDDEQIDELLSAAGNASGEERAQLYQEASERLYTEVGAIIPIAEQTNLLLLGDGVEYEPNGLTGVEMRLSEITTD